MKTRFINQNKFENQTVFSARFDKQDAENQILDESDFNSKLKIFKNITESDFDNNDVRSQFE